MAVIHAPNESYTGTSASVAFCNGKGSTNNPHLIQWFREHGYQVEEEDSGKRKLKEDSGKRKPRKKKEEAPTEKDTADIPEDGAKKDGVDVLEDSAEEG